jgi:hypothetical protein
MLEGGDWCGKSGEYHKTGYHEMIHISIANCVGYNSNRRYFARKRKKEKDLTQRNRGSQRARRGRGGAWRSATVRIGTAPDGTCDLACSLDELTGS